MSEENDEQMIPTPSDFGHFVLEKELGHGGMGGVYLARDKMLDRKVAIKVMLKSLGDDPAFVERFQREAQAAARLNHPNIAQIYSFGTELGMPYIAMELVSGGSLDREMAANPGTMDVVRVMKIGQQMANALALAAEQGLVHGDVKPENVLFDADGNAKLVDFGLAAMQGDSNEIWGTPYYISPEKVRRQKIDFRADIYSLGGTLYHALTGVAPFEGADATEVVKARFNGPPRKPSEVRPDLPPEIDTIIMRMLELEPAMRYPTYQSLLGDFKRLLSKSGSGKTGRMAGPRVKIRGTKIKMKLSADEKQPAGGGAPADLAPVEGDELEEDGKKHLSVGALVGLVAGGIVLLVVLVVGGLLWYVHAEKAREVREARQQLVETRDKARSAIANSLKSIRDFGEKFHELVAKCDREMAGAVRQIRGLVPSDLKAAAAAFIDLPPTQDIRDAIAYTNEIFAAARAQTAAGPGTAAADAKAASGANKTVAAPAKPESGEATNPEERLPAAVKQVAELWADVYLCRAAEIRVQGTVALLLEKGRGAEALTGEDEATVRALAKLSQTLVDGYEQLRGMKCVEQAQRKAAVIRTRSTSLVRSAEQQIRRMLDKAERLAKAKAEKAAREAAAAKAAEERKAKVEAEVRAAQETFDALVGDRLRYLDWQRACDQLDKLLEEGTTTPEGREEVRSQKLKVQYMQELHELFIKCAKDFKFRDGTVVAAVSAKTITLRRKSRSAAERPQELDWTRFYGKTENVGYMNQLLNHFVLRGRDTIRTGPVAWSKQMLGAALTLQLLYTDVEGAAEVVPIYVKKAAAEYEDCVPQARKWFPDVKIEE